MAAVVSGWTGIPVGKMVLDEIKTVMSIKERLEERVIGQSHALEVIAERMRATERYRFSLVTYEALGDAAPGAR